MSDAPTIPVILAMVRSLTVREALEASSDQPRDFRLHWSLIVDAKDDQAVIAQVADLHPALIVIELDQPANWLPKVHSDPATRRIPGIAYYQIQRRNYAGARKMFLRMVQLFAPLPDYCMGINVAQLHKDALAARAHLEALGPERVAEFDPSLLKPINYEGRL